MKNQIPITTCQSIYIHTKPLNISSLESVGKSIFTPVPKNESMSLLEYLNTTCSYIDKQEQHDTEALNLDFFDLSGRELSLDELLED